MWYKNTYSRNLHVDLIGFRSDRQTLKSNITEKHEQQSNLWNKGSMGVFFRMWKLEISLHQQTVWLMVSLKTFFWTCKTVHQRVHTDQTTQQCSLINIPICYLKYNLIGVTAFTLVYKFITMSCLIFFLSKIKNTEKINTHLIFILF